MVLSRWQPFNPVWNQLQQLQSEMNRLVERWGDRVEAAQPKQISVQAK
jgi:hypothetical protein